MSNKQIMKDVFDNEFNANKIRNQILLKSEKKTKKNMIKFLQYATFFVCNSNRWYYHIYK